MNILIISNLYPPNEVGGYERLCFGMASALADGNNGISVLTSGYGGLLEDFPGQKVERSLQLLADEKDIYNTYSASAARKKAVNLHNARVLERKLAEVRPDVLFVWNLFFLDRSFLQAIQDADCRTVFLLTDNWLILFLRPGFWYRYFTGDVLSSRSWTAAIRAGLGRLMARIRRKNLPVHGEAIFPSRFMQVFYDQAGFRFRRTAVIPHGVRLNKHEEGEYRDRTALVEKGWIRLLFAGRIVEMKGVHTILEALPEIIWGLPGSQIRLMVLGEARDREYMKKLEAMILRLNLGRMVEFQPTVQESDLFGVFQAHDIFLFPSLYEPFSLTLIHALASGIPVVASDVGGNKEIVFPGRTGLLFSKGDSRSLAKAVLDLAGKPNLRQAVAVEARKASRGFTFQTMVQQVEAYLRFPGY
jgi:glycosyltransferase involved in cell wall biosynthesis